MLKSVCSSITSEGLCLKGGKKIGVKKKDNRPRKFAKNISHENFPGWVCQGRGKVCASRHIKLATRSYIICMSIDVYRPFYLVRWEVVGNMHP